jgi:CRP/FNR family transcriptional regulator
MIWIMERPKTAEEPDPRMTAGPMPRIFELGCEGCAVRRRSVCSDCNREELAELDRIKSYRTYREGETIAWAGERAHLVGNVLEGVAMLSRTLSDGRRQMVGLLLPSDFLGRPGRETHRYDVVAATDVAFCMFRKPEFERIVARTPRLEHRMLEMTLDELDAAREWMILLGRKTAREKIASLIVFMARRDAILHDAEAQDGLRFPLHITREAMADYLGLTIETVSRQISAFRREGLIELGENRMIHVPDFDRLVEESGGDESDAAG